MTATAAEALELALWLHRAPARRAALLGRPLPDGIGQLLRVASGAREQVTAAATITGEDESTILEAVRFYLQQILFHEDADAYRVLGLRPDDSQQRAREHHRLLQQWLHPDRRGADEWESVYATRINQAWSQLRTPQARAAYDAALLASWNGAPDMPGGSRHGGEYRDAARPIPVQSLQASRTRSRNLTLVVLVGCVGLLVLIAMRRETPPEWPENRPTLAEDRDAPATPAERPPLATLGAALTEAIASPGQAAPSPAQAPPPISPSVTAVTPPAPRPAAPPPASFAQVAAASLTVPARPPARRAEAAVPPVARAPETQATEPRTAMPEPPVRVAAVATDDVPAAAPVLAAASSPPPPPAPAASLVPASRPVPVQVPDAFGRMSQAQDRTRAVLAYLGDPSAGPPPVWNDLRTMQQAQQIRSALQDRRGGGGRGRAVELQAPQWRLSADGARLESRYRTGVEQGTLGLAFTWREDQLLVSGISLDPDA